MHRVGACPRCGAPIYTPSISGHTAPQPVTYTCSCRKRAADHAQRKRHGVGEERAADVADGVLTLPPSADPAAPPAATSSTASTGRWKRASSPRSTRRSPSGRAPPDAREPVRPTPRVESRLPPAVAGEAPGNRIGSPPHPPYYICALTQTPRPTAGASSFPPT